MSFKGHRRWWVTPLAAEDSRFSPGMQMMPFVTDLISELNPK
jgi:hypothetical protein